MRWTFENDQPIVAHQMFANGCPRMRPQSKKTTFWKEREAAFCEGSREAPGRLCKKLLPRSFLPTGSFAIFLYTFLFRCSDHTFGPGGRKYWPPRALKTWGARTTISQNNYTANFAHRLPGSDPMVADAGLGSRRAHFYPPSWHIFRRKGADFMFSTARPYKFCIPVVPYFSHLGLTIFSPRGDHVFAHFRAQILSGANCLNVGFYTCFQWFCHHLSETKSGAGITFLSAWWSKFWHRGDPFFDKFPHALFEYFGDQKLLEFCFVFDNIWAPAAPWWDVRMPGTPVCKIMCIYFGSAKPNKTFGPRTQKHYLWPPDAKWNLISNQQSKTKKVQ